MRQLQQKAEVFDILQRHARQKMPACPNRNVSATPKQFCDFLIWNSPDPQFSIASHPHVSVETTERYLGCKPRFRNAVNDRIGIEPD